MSVSPPETNTLLSRSPTQNLVILSVWTCWPVHSCCAQFRLVRRMPGKTCPHSPEARIEEGREDSCSPTKFTGAETKFGQGQWLTFHSLKRSATVRVVCFQNLFTLNNKKGFYFGCGGRLCLKSTIVGFLDS